MSTINEKLYELTQLYQEKAIRNESLEKEIRDYEHNERKVDQCKKKLLIIKIAIMLLFLTVISSVAIATMGIEVGGIISMFSILILDKGMLFLEQKGILEKIARKFFPKKYAELDRLNATLEKIDIVELQCQLIGSKEKEFQCGLALDTFRKEAEKLTNIPSEEDIKQEYQRQLAERNAQINAFFQEHVLTDEELNILNNATEKKKVKQ